MIAIDNTLVSDDILQEHFVCDLKKCKGACCVVGDAGAPLEEEELSILENIYESIKPYISADGIRTIKETGLYVKDTDNEYTTPLIDNKECAYAIFENGIAKCAIEKAYSDGKISFKKPISCHLYPISITKYGGYDAINYHEWEVCSPACELGRRKKTTVFEFLKEPLIRKYGTKWFKQLQFALSSLK